MIKKITLDNFKAFDHAEIEIKPMTIIVGPNNSGKTSLLQSVSLIQQTLRSGSDVLKFKDAINFGDFDSIVHQNSKIKEIGLKFDFDDDTYFDIKIRKNEEGKPYVKDFRCDNGLFEYKIKNIKKTNAETNKDESEYYTSDGFEFDSKTLYTELEPLLKGGVRPNFYRDTFFFKIRTFGEDDLNSVFNKVQAIDWDTSYKNEWSLKKINDKLYRTIKFYFDLQKISSDYFQRTKQKFEKIKYIGPIRASPRRSYETGLYDNVGFMGEHAAHMIAEDPILYERVQQILINLEIAKSLEILKFENQKNFEIKMKTDITKCGVNLADVGSGTSQILPLLVQCSFSQDESLILIEQPEIHLHPKVQADFGSFLVEILKSRKNKFLIETHSEYFIERIRTLIMKNPELAEDVIIYYVEQNKKSKHSDITKIEINSKGQYPELPEGYLVNFKLEEIDEQMDLMLGKFKENIKTE